MHSPDWPRGHFDVPGRTAGLPFLSERGKRNILGEKQAAPACEPIPLARGVAGSAGAAQAGRAKEP